MNINGSNEESLEELEKTIQQKLTLAKKANKAALEANRDIGDALNAAKIKVPKGQYGRWTLAKFRITKTWSTKLRRVVAEWPDILRSQAWATDRGRTLSTKELGVEGALALLDEYLADTQPNTAAKKKVKHPVRADQASDTEAKIKHFENELDAAQEQIQFLKHKLAGTVTHDDKDRALKIYSRYQNHAATAGEKNSCTDKLTKTADKYGHSYKAFLDACGLS